MNLTLVALYGPKPRPLADLITVIQAELIDQQTADQIFRMQQAALRQTIRFTKYMTLVLSQRVMNAVFSVIGWMIYNKSGINFFPELVKTD